MIPARYISYWILTLPCMWHICLALNGTILGGDTISENDPVTNQYLNLPYPTVTDEDIASEQAFYRSDRYNGNMFMIVESLTLEKMNHYLFNGSENFR